MSTNDELFNALFGDDVPTDEDFDFMGILNSLNESVEQNDMAPRKDDNPYVFGFNPANSFQAHVYQLCIAFVQSESAAQGIPVLTTDAVFQLMPAFCHILEGMGIERDKVVGFAVRFIGGFTSPEYRDSLPEMADILVQTLDENFKSH